MNFDGPDDAEALPIVDAAEGDDANAVALADPRQESQDAFTQRMGRWRRDVRGAMDSEVFLAVMAVFQLVHAAQDHHLYFVEQFLSKTQRSGQRQNGMRK